MIIDTKNNNCLHNTSTKTPTSEKNSSSEKAEKIAIESFEQNSLPNSVRSRSNSVEGAQKMVLKSQQEKTHRENVHMWSLNRSCYAPNQKLCLAEFQKALQKQIKTLFEHIENIEKENYSNIDRLIVFVLGSASTFGVKYCGAISAIWSALAPVQQIKDYFTGETEHLKNFAHCFCTYGEIDQMTAEYSTLMTSYYRAEILAPIDNPTRFEKMKETIEQFFGAIKVWWNQPGLCAQLVTGSDDKEKELNADYKKHWEALISRILAQILVDILALPQETVKNISTHNYLEIIQLLMKSSAPISNKPLAFDEGSIHYTTSLLSSLAYECESKIEDVVKREWKYEKYQFFFEKDIQAFFIEDKDRIIISFRGTANRANWLLDGNITTTSPWANKGISVHSGFWNGLTHILPRIKSRIKADETKSIYLTGHSLGGALALLTAFDLATTHLKSDGSNIHLYTFAQPKCGNTEFVQAIERTLRNNYVRFVNYLDPVTHLPLHYADHPGKLQWIDAKGKIYDKEGQEAQLKQLEENPGFYSKLLSFFTRSETHKIRTNGINIAFHFSNHYMGNYHKHLSEEQPTFMDSVEDEYRARENMPVAYQLKHPTHKDGASIIHAIMGQYNGKEYVYKSGQEEDTPLRAKLAFTEALQNKYKKDIEIKRLFFAFLKKYVETNNFKKTFPKLYDKYREDLQNKNEIQKRNFIDGCKKLTIFEDLFSNTQAHSVLLRHLKKDNPTISDKTLLEGFEKNPGDFYEAIVPAKKELKEEIARLKDKGVEDTWRSLLAHLDDPKHKLNLERFLEDQIARVYFKEVLSPDYYLSERELKLIALLFNTKVIVYSNKDKKVIEIYNEKATETVAVELNGSFYSRLEKENNEAAIVKFQAREKKVQDHVLEKKFFWQTTTLHIRDDEVYFLTKSHRAPISSLPKALSVFEHEKIPEDIVSIFKSMRDKDTHTKFDEHRTFFVNLFNQVAFRRLVIEQNLTEYINFFMNNGLSFTCKVLHPLWYASYCGAEKSFEALLNDETLDLQFKEEGTNKTLLYYLAEKGYENSVESFCQKIYERLPAESYQELLDYNLNHNSGNGNGDTALTIAVEKEHFKIANFLIKQGIKHTLPLMKWKQEFKLFSFGPKAAALSLTANTGIVLASVVVCVATLPLLTLPNQYFLDKCFNSLNGRRFQLLALDDPRFNLFCYLSNNDKVNRDREFKKHKDFYTILAKSEFFQHVVLSTQNERYLDFFQRKNLISMTPKYKPEIVNSLNVPCNYLAS